MTELQDTLRLQTWLSPAFPTGAFAYSHGLEGLVGMDVIRDREDLANWIGDLLRHGSAWNDAVFLIAAHTQHASPDALQDLSDLAAALSPSAGRLLETVAQGTAFLQAAAPWTDEAVKSLPKEIPLPIAVGALSGRHCIPKELAVGCYLNAFTGNQVQAALRLFRLGQSDGVAVLATLEDVILKTASRAAESTIDDLGSCALMADIASQTQETLDTRIFRS